MKCSKFSTTCAVIRDLGESGAPPYSIHSQVLKMEEQKNLVKKNSKTLSVMTVEVFDGEGS